MCTATIINQTRKHNSNRVNIWSPRSKTRCIKLARANPRTRACASVFTRFRVHNKRYVLLIYHSILAELPRFRTYENSVAHTRAEKSRA